MYIEVSSNFPATFHRDCVTKVSKPEFLAMIGKVVSEVKADLERSGRGGLFVGAKIVFSCLRVMSLEQLEAELDECILLKQQFPHLIAGFTLVGSENELYPLTYYLPVLLRFREKQKELGIIIPFIFHAGETLGDGDQADDNLYDAVLLLSKRIGHAFSIPKHPLLMQMCRERKIAIEVCPISNEILRLTTSMPMHPLPILINNGLPVVIGSDDPAIFGNMGLSYDFYQILVSSEITSLATLKMMARDSIEFSMLDDKEKVIAYGLWTKQWEEFVKVLVSDE